MPFEHEEVDQEIAWGQPMHSSKANRRNQRLRCVEVAGRVRSYLFMDGIFFACRGLKVNFLIRRSRRKADGARLTRYWRLHRRA